MSDTQTALQKKVNDAREAVRQADTDAKRKKAVAAYDKAFAEMRQAVAAAHIEKKRKGNEPAPVAPIAGPTPAEAKK